MTTREERLRKRCPAHGKTVDYIRESIECGELYVTVCFTDGSFYNIAASSPIQVDRVRMFDADGNPIRKQKTR